MRLKAIFTSIALCLLFSVSSYAKGKTKQMYYQLETYYFSTPQQEAVIDQYLGKAYLPALHGYGLKNIGVFKPIANDTTSSKVVYVVIAFSSWKQVREISEKLQTNLDYRGRAAAFLGAPFDHAAYNRKTITLMKAFSMAPTLELPILTAPLSERVYELRSYESASDNLFKNKVEMFNEGGEVALFKSLGFNAIFYGEVVVGAKMPNLMYITSFNNMNDRNAHWEIFRNDPVWKELSTKAEYQHNVSKSEIILTHPAAYSDF